MTLTPEGYCPRLVDKDVDLMLRTFRAVSIMGPKWCGKTWTGENHANSEMRIADSTGPIPNRDIVASDPRVAMEGDQPRLIDEWQEVPQLWDKVRSTVDSNPRTGQYILTGSSVPVRQKYVHSGTGRIGTLRMGTMSLYEIGDSDGAVSLLSLFEGELGMVDCGEVWLDHLIDLAIRGGWPGNDGGDGDPGLLARGYVDKVVEDAAYLDGRRRSERKMRMLIRSLARNESTLASNEKIMSDMRESDRETISSDTYTDYMDCLDRLFLTDDTPCFSPNLRSDARIGKSPKRHLVDVSLSIAALRYTKGMLKENLDAFGFMFEAMCEHDIRLYAEYLGGRMFHYRDGRGREMDAVVEMPDGRWGAFEIKLGTGQIEDAARNLLSLSDFFTRNGHPPAVLCVVCGMTTYAYRRPDGVYVVPLTSLGP